MAFFVENIDFVLEPLFLRFFKSADNMSVAFHSHTTRKNLLENG